MYVAESPSGRDTVTADTLLFGDGILGDAATLGSGVSPMVTRRVVEPGARLGRYLVIRTLGAGAMGSWSPPMIPSSIARSPSS